MSALTADEAQRAADWLERGFDDEHPVTALRSYAEKIDPPETVESLRETLLGEHDAWERTERALAEANTELVKVRAERDGARVSAGRYLAALQESEELAAALSEAAHARWRVLRHGLAERDKAEAERDKANAELARLRVLMRAATATPREHWLGGDHSNQTPYPVVRE